MGLGYTTILYDERSLEDGIDEIGACRYDGVEIGLEKVRHAGPNSVGTWIETNDLDLYCVMSEWLESDEAATRVADDAAMVANLGAPFLGLCRLSAAEPTTKRSSDDSRPSARPPRMRG